MLELQERRIPSKCIDLSMWLKEKLLQGPECWAHAALKLDILEHFQKKNEKS